MFAWALSDWALLFLVDQKGWCGLEKRSWVGFQGVPFGLFSSIPIKKDRQHYISLCKTIHIGLYVDVYIGLYIGIVHKDFNFMRWFLSVLVMVLTLLGGHPLMPADAAMDRKKLLIFGDSLVAGYGLPPGVAFPDQLQHALDADGAGVDIINGGISGDTMAGGASRIAWSLADRPDAVVVVLGGNDALRGLSPENMNQHLNTIIAAIQDQGLPLLVAGMLAPANMGADYGVRFQRAFADAITAAKQTSQETAQQQEGYIGFYPFFLDGVALDPLLNQDDGIHPNEAGVAEIVQRIKPSVMALIDAIPQQ